MLKTQESMKCVLRSCELCIVNVNEHMKTLQVLVNQICWTTFLALRRNSLDLLATVCVDQVYICTTVQKNKHFHAFVEFSVISVHKKYSSEKKNKKELIARFELPSSTIRVLDLAHCTTATDIVILFPL